MLLNELKRIFEADRDVLQGALSSLNVRTEISGFDKTDKKPGDVHPSVKSVLKKSIVAAEYVAPSKSEIEALISTVEIKKRTLDSLSNLSGTLDQVEKDFTRKLVSLKDQISDIAATGDGKTKGDVASSIQLILKELRSGSSSSIRQTHLASTDESFRTRKDEITNMLMKASTAASYSNRTIIEVKNFLKSKSEDGWLEADGTTVRMSGVSELKRRVERFYIILVALQQNTNMLAQQVTAIKAKGET